MNTINYITVYHYVVYYIIPTSSHNIYTHRRYRTSVAIQFKSILPILSVGQGTVALSDHSCPPTDAEYTAPRDRRDTSDEGASLISLCKNDPTDPTDAPCCFDSFYSVRSVRGSRRRVLARWRSRRWRSTRAAL